MLPVKGLSPVQTPQWSCGRCIGDQLKERGRTRRYCPCLCKMAPDWSAGVGCTPLDRIGFRKR